MKESLRNHFNGFPVYQAFRLNGAAQVGQAALGPGEMMKYDPESLKTYQTAKLWFIKLL